MQIEGYGLVRDRRELIAEAQSMDTSGVSVPLELSSLFTRCEVDFLVVWRRNRRINVKIAATRHLR